jgi:hypothetical protein
MQDLALMSVERKYIGPMKKQFSGVGARNEYWPTMAEEPTTLQFLPDKAHLPDMPIQNNQEIRIATTETSVGKFKYLGYWKPTDAYYYSEGYDEQVWVVERATPNLTGPLVFGERIYIKNKMNGQFLSPSGDWLGRSNKPYPWIASTDKEPPTSAVDGRRILDDDA